MQQDKYYVSMTDKFCTHLLRGQIDKMIIECDSYNEAEIVAQNANNRSDMKNVNICSKKPYYNKERYRATYKTKEECSRFFKVGGW